MYTLGVNDCRFKNDYLSLLQIFTVDIFLSRQAERSFKRFEFKCTGKKIITQRSKPCIQIPIGSPNTSLIDVINV